MNNKAQLFSGLLVATMFWSAAAYSATVTLIPSDSIVGQGDAFTIDLMLDANDAPGSHPGEYQGDILITYDPDFFTFTSFSAAQINTTLPVVTGSASGLNTLTLTFGALQFNSSPDAGLIGTFVFAADVAQLGVSDITVDDANALGSFANQKPVPTSFQPDFFGTTVQIVPVPAAAWLFASALGLLGWARRSSARSGGA